MIPVMPSFSKSYIFNCFPSTLKRKAGVSNSSDLKSVFEKFCFRYGLVRTIRPNRRNKVAFSNSSGVDGEANVTQQISVKKWFWRLYLINTKIKLAIFHPQGVINSEL